MVQAILFLKENRDLWDEDTVYDAIANVKKNAADEHSCMCEQLLHEQEATQAALAAATV